MKSIFLRTYIAIALLMFGAFLATFKLIDNLTEQREAIEFQQILGIEAKLIQAKLAIAPHAQWNTIITEYKSGFGIDVVLKTQAEVARQWPDYELRMIDNKVFSSHEAIPWWLLLRIANSDQFLLFQEHEIEFEESESDTFSDIILLEWLENILPLSIVYLILTVGVFFLAHRISRPINELSLVAKKLGKGCLDVRANTQVPAPINALAVSFNGMATALQRLIIDQQVLMGAIPHELRTPLSRIRFALDMTRKLDSVDELRKQIEDIDGYVDDLKTAVEEALLISQLSSDEPIPFHSFDLAKLLADVCESTAIHSTKTFSIQLPVSIETFGHSVLIKRAIGNVVGNALKYASREVKISANSENGLVTVSIDDDGSGIPEDKRQNVFSPFSRLEQHRGRSTGGVGLGLALVNMILRKHLGSVIISTSPLGGARFELRWDANNLQGVDTLIRDEE